MKNKLIEKRDVERDYGFDGVVAVIDHHKHGRLLIMDGFGGIDSLEGGAVRWKHGMAIKMHDGDTLADLDKDWNEYTSVYEAVTQGYDDSRPVLEWEGYMIEKVAKSVGLA